MFFNIIFIILCILSKVKKFSTVSVYWVSEWENGYNDLHGKYARRYGKDRHFICWILNFHKKSRRFLPVYVANPNIFKPKHGMAISLHIMPQLRCEVPEIPLVKVVFNWMWTVKSIPFKKGCESDFSCFGLKMLSCMAKLAHWLHMLCISWVSLPCYWAV